MRLRPDNLPTFRRRGPSVNGSPLGSPPPPPSRRSLFSRLDYRARSFGLAALLALAALILTVSYVRSYKSSVDASAAPTAVLVAARDIPAGTPGSTLVTRRLVVRKELPRRALVPGAVSRPRQVGALVAGEDIYAGEQVSVRQFEPATQRGLRGELNGTMRAIVVPGDRNQLLAGIVRTDDRVDVVASLPVASGPSGREAIASRVILRDLPVLRAPAVVEGGKTTQSAVLGLTDRQAQKLFYAMKHGNWALVLRPADGAADSGGGIDVAETVLGINTEPRK
jgi:Flp pilus assembly protein CpaB